MICCYECGHLDKSRKIESENGISFRYGCKDSYTCGWIIKGKETSELKTMGCSDFVKAGEQVSLWEWEDKQE